MNLPKILQVIRPGAEWIIRGTEYADLEWLDTIQSKPTQAECEAAEYYEKRQSEYPYVGDQLDAIWKGGQAATDMKAQVDAVKAKYPKP